MHFGHRYYIAYGVTGFMVPGGTVDRRSPLVVYTRMGGTSWWDDPPDHLSTPTEFVPDSLAERWPLLAL